jgi:hypothetical protein
MMAATDKPMMAKDARMTDSQLIRSLRFFIRAASAKIRCIISARNDAEGSSFGKRLNSVFSQSFSFVFIYLFLHSI